MATAAVPDLHVSLVIPIRNEVSSLPTLIESIRAQKRLPDEVILVDGGSTDATAALARSLTADDVRFRVVEAGPASPGRGRNVGIEAAHHDWIALTDAGIRLDPRWLENLTAAVVAMPDADVVYGNLEAVERTWFEHCAALAYLPPKVDRPGGRMRGPSIATSLLRRSAWEKVGRFPDLRAGEDLIFMERLRAAGARVAWAPKATIWWQLQPNLAGTFRRFALYSFHTARVGRQHDWQYGVARQYATAVVLLVLTLTHSYAWAAVLALAVATRVALTLLRRREPALARPWLLPAEFVTAAVILLTIDLAMFVGWARTWWAPTTEPPTPRVPEP